MQNSRTYAISSHCGCAGVTHEQLPKYDKTIIQDFDITIAYQKIKTTNCQGSTKEPTVSLTLNSLIIFQNCNFLASA